MDKMISKRRNINRFRLCLFVLLIQVMLSCSEHNIELVISQDGDDYIIRKGRKEVYRITGETADEVFSNAIRLADPGDVILVQEGYYPINRTITLKSDITIKGKGALPLIYKPTRGAIISGENVHNVSIEKLHLKAEVDMEGDTSHGVYILGHSRYITVNSCRMDSIDGGGIFIGNSQLDCQYFTLTNNTIYDCVGGPGIGLMFGAGNALIAKNVIKRTRHHCIILSSGGSNCRIFNNHIEESGKYYRIGDYSHGIAIDAGYVLNRGRNHIIQGNTILKSGSAGIEVGDSQDSVVIKDNFIDGTGYASREQYGIYFGGGNTASHWVEITDNVVKNTKWSGIRVDSNHGILCGGHTTMAAVERNTIENTGKYGILIGVVDSAIVRKNHITNAEMDGIKVKGLNTDDRALRIHVINDSIYNSMAYAISVEYADNITITGNEMCSNTGKIFEQKYEVSNLKMKNNSCLDEAITISN